MLASIMVRTLTVQSHSQPAEQGGLQPHFNMHGATKVGLQTKMGGGWVMLIVLVLAIFGRGRGGLWRVHRPEPSTAPSEPSDSSSDGERLPAQQMGSGRTPLGRVAHTLGRVAHRPTHHATKSWRKSHALSLTSLTRCARALRLTAATSMEPTGSHPAAAAGGSPASHPPLGERSSSPRWGAAPRILVRRLVHLPACLLGPLPGSSHTATSAQRPFQQLATSAQRPF
jgi:hypothetical protein